MATVDEIEAAPKLDDGKLKQEPDEDDENELSPIEEVRLTVPNTDDPSLPVWTFRMWFLGLISCALLSFLNTFFGYRSQQLIVTQITVQVTTLPIGRFMASTLPTTKFHIPGFGSRLFSLNPGPFNMKEHVLITIFANAGSAFGNGPALAVRIVTIIKAFYGRNISFVSAWLLILTTQKSCGRFEWVLFNFFTRFFTTFFDSKKTAVNHHPGASKHCHRPPNNPESFGFLI
ncbi:Oligopeptide transporter OPT superfamily [Corchorus capsularis]|uniref:Oligopeptide transporter OPT superfamily n=1 Tax=Corchorus capsularis TaxID=210143 RepID=A0A1R3FYG0_COCAP|nr:Oligopeptide transporter OPT superfamily [Corchorus capsularis]